MTTHHETGHAAASSEGTVIATSSYPATSTTVNGNGYWVRRSDPELFGN